MSYSRNHANHIADQQALLENLEQNSRRQRRTRGPKARRDERHERLSREFYLSPRITPFEADFLDGLDGLGDGGRDYDDGS